MMSEIKPGDVVVSAASGPYMLVEEIRSGDDEVACSWFDTSHHLQSGVFSMYGLRSAFSPSGSLIPNYVPCGPRPLSDKHAIPDGE